jgi:hypothetical protein
MVLYVRVAGKEKDAEQLSLWLAGWHAAGGDGDSLQGGQAISLLHLSQTPTACEVCRNIWCIDM